MNGADIQYKENLKWTMENTLERMQSGNYHGRETENGVKVAIEYINGIQSEILTEEQLKKAIRFSMFRDDVSKLKF